MMKKVLITLAGLVICSSAAFGWFHHKLVVAGNSNTFRVFDYDTSSTIPGNMLPGVDNLNPSLTMNGVTVTPMYRYKGGDAGASAWAPWTYGESLALQTGTAPSYNQGSPLLGTNDVAVKGNGGG